MMRGKLLALEAWRFEILSIATSFEIVRYHHIILRFVKYLEFLRLRHKNGVPSSWTEVITQLH